MNNLVAGLSAGIAIVVLTAALLARRRFNRTIDALDRRLAEAQTKVGARSNLPGAVIALATRLGSDRTNPARFVDIRQTGTMWFKPGG